MKTTIRICTGLLIAQMVILAAIVLITFAGIGKAVKLVLGEPGVHKARPL